MDISLLQSFVEEIKKDIDFCVKNSAFINSSGEVQTSNGKGEKFENGLQARSALIRSSKLILRIHELVKISLNAELSSRMLKDYEIHPPIDCPSPEKHVWGLLKKKQQEVVVLFKNPNKEVIDEGPLKGDYDLLGRETTKTSIVIGVRSQLSSIDKNFDTLMERAFAETMNLRLRHPKLIMGEVYMLPVKEYDEQAMKLNKVAFKNKFTDVEKFISIFNGFTGRQDPSNIKEIYKYEKSSLILVDFSQSPVKIYKTLDELKEDGIVSMDFNGNYNSLNPQNFSTGIVQKYLDRHS
jgi:hypothetical protein